MMPMLENIFGGERRVYLDYAGATPLRASALRAMQTGAEYIGNPGALHKEATSAASALEAARKTLAAALACKPGEIIFTSGGSEGNNLAILGFANAKEKQGILSGTHMIVSALEHPSVLDTMLLLSNRGVDVSVVSPNKHGTISPEAVEALLRPETVFISIGWANSEVGTVQPLSAITQKVRAYEKVHATHITFHSDMGQAPLYLFPQVHTLGVDLATFDAGKIGGPRGAGMLFVKRGTSLLPIMYGGSQEKGLRPGTQSLSNALGFAAAFLEVNEKRDGESKRMSGLQAHLIDELMGQKALEGLEVNGTSKNQLPHILNISIPDIDNEYVTLSLDALGFAVATKSACREGEKESHVVAALLEPGEDSWRARTALRISMGEDTKSADLDRFVATLSEIVPRSRHSPS